jgi:serine/threonine-protein kinase
MNRPHDLNATIDVPSTPADSLDAGLAAGFGAPRSSLGDMRPPLLNEAEGENAHIVQPKSDAMPSPEQTGDRYQLQGEIARGGMGAVLRGRDVDLGRDLAVKVLLEKHAHRPEVARRFVEEAQIGGQLQHPGVVPVYDIGRFGERPFFTMKLVKGNTLASLLAERNWVARPEQEGEGRGEHREAEHALRIHAQRVPPAPPDLPRLLGIALQVAQTLAYAHAKGVIHRDLKPANIMVGAFGEVQVMDWGLAKVLAEGGIADEEKASRERERPDDVTTIRTARSTGSTGSFGTDTEAGSLLGTPAYMPPEQANGDVANLDRRADVFGMGAILCEILTGNPPYVGRSAEEVRRKACNGDLADALARLHTCGADVDLIVVTKACLSPEAIDRPKDALAVAEALTKYLDGVQERLRQAELAEAEAKARAVEEVKRRRLTLALAATVLLALTLGGGGWLWVKNERDARQAQVTREVNEALNQAMALREKSKAAMTGGAPLFAQAREQAQRALALVENGPADPSLVVQVTDLQAELDNEDKDRKLVLALDEARLAQAETVADRNDFAREKAVPQFRAAFAAYGLAAGQSEPAESAQRIRQRPAAVREAIVAALDEWDVLAGDPDLGIEESQRKWLQAVLAAAEPDEAWSRQMRAARAVKDPAQRQTALDRLAASADETKLPARRLTQLALQLRPVAQVALLRRAQTQYPADFWVNHNLALALLQVTPPHRAEAVRFLTAAVALRPDSPGCVMNLGFALLANGQVDEAIACHQKAIALDPKYAVAQVNLGLALKTNGNIEEAIACLRKAVQLAPSLAPAHFNLGNALLDKGLPDEAIASFRKGIELDPNRAPAHCNLGVALRKTGQVDAAIACLEKAIALDPKYTYAHSNLGAIFCDVKRDYDGAITCFRRAIELDAKSAQTHFSLGNALRGKGQVDRAMASWHQAIELDPKYADPHYNLGSALAEKGQFDEAIACYRRAIALDPKDAGAHDDLAKAVEQYAAAQYNLGNQLKDKGQLDKAIGCYKKAIELKSTFAQAHCNLGDALRQQGRFAESLAAVKRGHELGTKQPGWRYPSAQWVREAKELAALEGKLPAFLKGEFQPRDTAERLGLAGVCQGKKLYAAAARVYADAFAADPKLADDLKAAHRYNAACSASLAAADQSEDAPQLDDREKTRLHKQALDWLRADLALWTKQLESGKPADRTATQKTLRHWQQDGDLAGIRDKAALAKLPPEERAGYERLWADVAALVKKAEGASLGSKGQLDAAIACFRKAIEIDPKDAKAHYDLGNVLTQKGQLDAAIASYKKAIEFQPNFAEVHCNLGHALRQQGRFAEALAAFRRGHELGTKRPGWPYPSAQWVREAEEAERLAAMELELPFLKGEVRPWDTARRVGLIRAFQVKKLHHSASRLYADAFAADPKLAEQLSAGHRYNAACHAALAAAGQGEDAGKLDDKERGRLRKQALDWLRVDLTAWQKRLKSGRPGEPAQVRAALSHWQKDTDLASVRDQGALVKLPADERAAFTKFWADVAALGKTAEKANQEQPSAEAGKQLLQPQGGKKIADKRVADKRVADSGDDEAAKVKLATDYLKAGKKDQALPLLVEIWNSKKARLGPEHPDTLQSMNQLGVVYWQLGQLDKSVPLFEKLLKIREAKLGRDDPETLQAVANLGVNYKDAGKLKEAIGLLEEALGAARKHPQLGWVVNPALDAYSQAGENAKVVNLLQEMLPAARKGLPPDSPQLAGLLAQGGMALLNLKKWAEAEPLLRECLTIREKTQPDVWATFNAKSMLGGVLLGQKKYADAEPLLLAGYEGMKKREKTIPPQGRPRLVEAALRLVQLYQALGKQDKVAQWSREREALEAPAMDSKKKNAKERKP